MQCRQQPREQVRSFLLPKVNFYASNFTEPLDWRVERITESSLIMDLSDAEVQDTRCAPLDMGAFPVHTVAVERVVKAAVVFSSGRPGGVFCFPSTVGGDFSASLVSSLV